MDFEELLEFHSAQGGAATICVREYEFQVPYGVVRNEGTRLVEIQEKPSHKFFVNAGIYVLEPNLLNRFMPNEAVDMPVMLQDVTSKGDKVSMFPIHEYWIDIGRVEEYERAKIDSSGGDA